MKTRLSHWLAGAAALALAGCSGDNELLETVPANSRCVVMMDVEDLMEEAGLKIHDGKLEAPDWLRQSLRGASTSTIAAVDQGLDLEHVAVVVGSGGETYMTMRVKDKEGLEKMVKELGPAVSVSSTSGYDAYAITGTGLMMVKDGQAWINMETYGVSRPETFATSIDNELKAAKKESVAKLSGIRDFLDSDKTLRVAISPELLGQTGVKELEGGWSLYSIDVEKDAILFNGGTQRSDGRAIEMPGTCPIDTKVFSYVPSTFTALVAAGLTPEFPWNTLTNYAGLFGGYQAQGWLSMALPYLRSLDGTVMAGAGPLGPESYGEPGPKTWQFMVMAHMPEANISEAVTSVSDLLKAGGISSTEENGMTKFSYQGTSLAVGNVDGYLTVANYDVKGGQDNKFGSMFQGKNGGAFLEIPSLRLIGPAMPEWGVRVEFTSEKTESKGKLTLPGCKEPVLQALLKASMM